MSQPTADTSSLDEKTLLGDLPCSVCNTMMPTTCLVWGICTHRRCADCLAQELLNLVVPGIDTAARSSFPVTRACEMCACDKASQYYNAEQHLRLMMPFFDELLERVAADAQNVQDLCSAMDQRFRDSVSLRQQKEGAVAVRLACATAKFKRLAKYDFITQCNKLEMEAIDSFKVTLSQMQPLGMMFLQGHTARPCTNWMLATAVIVLGLRAPSSTWPQMTIHYKSVALPRPNWSGRNCSTDIRLCDTVGLVQFMSGTSAVFGFYLEQLREFSASPERRWELLELLTPSDYVISLWRYRKVKAVDAYQGCYPAVVRVMVDKALRPEVQYGLEIHVCGVLVYTHPDSPPHPRLLEGRLCLRWDSMYV